MSVIRYRNKSDEPWQEIIAIKGDKLTPEEKQELVDEIITAVVGNIDSALDSIIEIQNNLMGVSE